MSGSLRPSQILKPGFLPSSPLARRLSAFSHLPTGRCVLPFPFSRQYRLELGATAYVNQSWLYTYSASQLTNQRQIILTLFGFPLLETTLLGCVDGVVESA